MPQTLAAEAGKIVEEAGFHLGRNDTLRALQLVEAALAIDPACAPAMHIAGLAKARRGDLKAGADLLERAIALLPRKGEWLADLGTVRYASGDFHSAAEMLSLAEELSPGDARISNLLGKALLKCGRAREAALAFGRAIGAGDSTPETLFSLGCACSQSRDFEAAIETFDRCLAVGPDDPRVHEKLADLCSRTRRHEKALEHRKAILRLKPGDVDAMEWFAWANIQASGVEESLHACERVIGIGQGSLDLHSAYLIVKLHHAEQTAASIRSAHEEWAAVRCGSARGRRPRPHLNSADADRKLRIGYVGGEFWLCPSYFFLMPMLRHHDRSRFEITLYNSIAKTDSATPEYESVADRFRNVHDLDDAGLARRIRADRIDVLVDLSGHYHGHGLLAFSRRPAPVQVTYPNYPATTGVSEIDYIFSDHWVCPEGREAQYTEQPYRLPAGYLAYEPTSGVLPSTDCPASRAGFVTFGIFQRPAKYNPGVWDSIARILALCPSSRLVLHYASADLDNPLSAVRRRFSEELASRGIAPERLSFHGSRPLQEHLAILAETDIALDSFPYNGQTTTCECLSLGVPVITTIGNTHVSRVGWELLARCGLDRFAGLNPDEYVRIAVDLASNPNALARAHRQVRTCFEQSMLLDAKAVTRGIEEGYRWMWRRWCESQNASQPNLGDRQPHA